ncbi:hypothetical protein [Microbacterium tumbae]
MSLPRPRYKRSTGKDTPEAAAPLVVPVVLPHVVATVGEDGRLSVEIDGSELTKAPIGRHAFGKLLDEIIRKRRTALRVDLIEADGTAYTDILTPPAAADQDETSEPDPAPAHAAPSETQGPRLVEVTGEGYVPGEDVAVAVVIRSGSATGTGHVRHLVELDELGSSGEVVLFGRISGTTTLIDRLT